MAKADKEVHQNYLNTFYRCITENHMICHDMVEEHKIVYIMSGKLTLRVGNRKVEVQSGHAVFVRKNHLAKEYKQPGNNGEPFKGLFFHLNASVLRKIATDIEIPSVKKNEDLKKELAVTLVPHPFLKALFLSLDEYFTCDLPMPEQLIKSKVYETVVILLRLMPQLAPVIFDFSEQWRVELQDFMEKNFLSNMSVEQFAHFSGRSLSSFKREFRDLFHTSPHRWLLNKRLEYAYSLISGRKCEIVEVYLKSGFKNQAHFITVFRKKFGITPVALANQ